MGPPPHKEEVEVPLVVHPSLVLRAIGQMGIPAISATTMDLSSATEEPVEQVDKVDMVVTTLVLWGIMGQSPLEGVQGGEAD